MAVKKLNPASASQPLMPVSNAHSAALKCQR